MTVRELEILSYLPSRLTNTELADHFYVSVNTIKTHMVHIYRKLGVTNRNAAVARGQTARDHLSFRSTARGAPETASSSTLLKVTRRG